MQKVYVFVDESGQDTKSEIFIVVAVVTYEDQNNLRQKLIEIEYLAKTGNRKWHKSRSDRRLNYLNLVLKKKVAKGDIYFGCYKKPIPYFLPMLDVIEKSIKKKVKFKYKAIIHIDGIDKKKAAEITNALRLRGISLELVKSRRDESEPIIRLTDMWAGCVRVALLKKEEEIKILKKAKQEKYIEDISK